jgi:hypothetical protein
MKIIPSIFYPNLLSTWSFLAWFLVSVVPVLKPRTFPDPLLSSRPVLNNPQMDSGRDRVVLFQVEFRDSPSLTLTNVNRSLVKIPISGGIYHISDDHFRDGFVFWDSGSRGFASDEFDVASAFLVPTIVAALFSHFWGFFKMLKT